MINGHGDDIHNYGGVRINFSSNIYAGFSHDGLFDHLSKSMRLVANYPEPSPLSLEKGLADINGLDQDCVMVTNGATEAIYLIARTFHSFNPVIPQPTFSEYADAYKGLANQSVEFHRRNIFWLCIPNNPTGYVMPKDDLISKIKSNSDDIFVIDESYAAYTKESIISLDEAVDYDNVLLLRSMTKDYGVPGLRLGYVVGNSNLLSKVRDNLMPWSVNALAIEAGHYLLEHKDEYHIPVEDLIAERRRVESRLHELGIATSPSDSHMLLCRLPLGKASELKGYLIANQGILIRDASNFQTLSPQHFRIAVQTEKENDELIKAISQWK